MSHDTSCTYDRVLSNRNAGKYDYPATNPCSITYFYRLGIGMAYFFTRLPVSNNSFFQSSGMSCCINLYVGSDKYIIAYFDNIIIYESTVHVDYNTVATQNMFPILAVEINIHAHIFAYASE